MLCGCRPTGNIGMFVCHEGYFGWTHFDQGNAKLDGLLTELDLTGNRYDIALVRYLFLVQIS